MDKTATIWVSLENSALPPHAAQVWEQKEGHRNLIRENVRQTAGSRRQCQILHVHNVERAQQDAMDPRVKPEDDAVGEAGAETSTTHRVIPDLIRNPS